MVANKVQWAKRGGTKESAKVGNVHFRIEMPDSRYSQTPWLWQWSECGRSSSGWQKTASEARKTALREYASSLRYTVQGARSAADKAQKRLARAEGRLQHWEELRGLVTPTPAPVCTLCLGGGSLPCTIVHDEITVLVSPEQVDEFRSAKLERLFDLKGRVTWPPEPTRVEVSPEDAKEVGPHWPGWTGWVVACPKCAPKAGIPNEP